ncbi:hypothetical protein [Blastopirellula retiformator]|uniref:Uncharacterized protein n=1 Tax=Blastopirellula retiformator TaxID=2527970 RepID=A0A5C5VNM9_9BACT|nr:hypothetical protein [Blastopirellula retiformator]TWT39525.1 hypothetical protein Enr8_12240 [Blastopirellula retiformator]
MHVSMHELESKPCRGSPNPSSANRPKSWYCSFAGRQISLGKDREAAHTKFHELMADQQQVKSDLTTLYELSKAYLD